MATPKFFAGYTEVNGKKAVKFRVINVNNYPEIETLLKKNGFGLAAVDCYTIVCTTPAEIDSARAGLDKFFAAGGVFKG